VKRFLGSEVKGQGCEHTECFNGRGMHCDCVAKWWSGVAVARWSWSTKLTYIGPGYYWDGWLYPGSFILQPPRPTQPAVPS